MEYKGYAGKVEFDSDARIFHGEVVGIRDVVTFQGRSVRELEKAFKDSVDDYLAFCRDRGEKPDKPCSGQFVVRIPPELHRRVNMLARAAGKSLNSWVAEHLDKESARTLRMRKQSKRRAIRSAIRN
jgi:predicted HicB family RNase H-like nuclease